MFSPLVSISVSMLIGIALSVGSPATMVPNGSPLPISSMSRCSPTVLEVAIVLERAEKLQFKTRK